MHRLRIPFAIVVALGWLLVVASGQLAVAAPRPGPPFPDPVENQAVYDYAGIFSPAAIASAEATIDAIEARTGSEVVVYTQNSGEFPTTEETEAKARKLMDQWGVGRAGINDGLVIFFDMQPNLQHGQVQLYAGPGFEAGYLSNEERQAIYQDDMLPHSRIGRLRYALAVALEKVDAAATPEHAAALVRSRQINAVIGLVGAPIVFLGLSGWAFFHWRRFGKDPVYLDDPSVLMPAPPPDLTAASGAMIMDGSTSRRALTTAMLDLASRGLIAFREDAGGLFGGAQGRHRCQPGQGRRRRRGAAAAQRAPPDRAGRAARARAASGAGSRRGRGLHHARGPAQVRLGGPRTSTRRSRRTWSITAGSARSRARSSRRWTGRGVLALVAGVIAAILGLNIPFSGLTLLGGAAIAGGIVVIVIAQAMPAVTMPGAMIRAMLAAYRRTLQKTMAQARSMQQVVDEAGLGWLDTPDQAVVWGTALGLQSDIEGVLSRSLEDVQAGRTTSGAVPYFPFWYQTSSGTPFMGSGAGGSGSSLFSDSGIPDVGGMMSALGTIGNSPSSSGGGGGFGGGGSGGGGGGAGGGF